MKRAKALHWMSRNWLLVFSIGWGLYVGLPFLAPVFMAVGWQGGAKLIYGFYSLLCHQMPQRSYFLFGSKTTYSLAEIQSVFQITDNPWVLRQFIGNADMGWKVAWSDRMVSLYTSILPVTWLWYLGRKQRKEMSLWVFGLFLLPMALDGGTHMISDFAGIGQGFRDSNIWLAVLTNGVLPASFYAGDALGSYNSWMRLFTGVLFGFAVAWFIMPYLDEMFSDVRLRFERRFERLQQLENSIENTLFE